MVFGVWPNIWFFSVSHIKEWSSKVSICEQCLFFFSYVTSSVTNCFYIYITCPLQYAFYLPAAIQLMTVRASPNFHGKKSVALNGSNPIFLLLLLPSNMRIGLAVTRWRKKALEGDDIVKITYQIKFIYRWD